MTADPSTVGTNKPETTEELCERWLAWCRSRRMFGPPPVKENVLARLQKAPPKPKREFDPGCSPRMAAFHMAYLSLGDGQQRRVFDLYYVHHVRPVKAAADALGISRVHFYRLLAEARQSLSERAAAIEHDVERTRAVVIDVSGESTP
ncbi:hypothetical protein [Pseudacidovorax sp. NFM-22]|uniref:hypothetical protein n=1 Tax=Pseudacidovorax sp. NFM-22 TaxID=2744469 RepID=UPI001F3C817B|nr:hypothetical protein [Pseudacidovorax sp. NFM-22]